MRKEYGTITQSAQPGFSVALKYQDARIRASFIRAIPTTSISPEDSMMDEPTVADRRDLELVGVGNKRGPVSFCHRIFVGAVVALGTLFHGMFDRPRTPDLGPGAAMHRPRHLAIYTSYSATPCTVPPSPITAPQRSRSTVVLLF